jgi:hypothetical protein
VGEILTIAENPRKYVIISTNREETSKTNNKTPKE